MSTHRFGMRAALTALALVLITLAVPAVARAAPSNDNLDAAKVVDSFPFTETVDISQASTEPSEPFYCTYSVRSVWYRFTMPSTGLARVDTSGSGLYDTFLRVFRESGPGFGGLSLMGCASPYYDGRQSLTFDAEAGVTYLVSAGSVYSCCGTLRVGIQLIVPPPNDDFANAQQIDSLPFANAVDTTAATREANEPPFACGYSPNDKTAWYSYTATESRSVTATTSGPSAWVIAAYTGPSLGSLNGLGCRWGGVLTIRAEAGKTYWFQIGQPGGWGTTRFMLDLAAPPSPQFWSNPFDPSVFDPVQFYDQSYDPAELGIETREWNFGDGATAVGPYVSHRYTEDGDYVVKLSVTTVDGRAGSLSRTIHVETHDVGIVKFNVPDRATVWRTQSILVAIHNSRYPETVEVELLKSAGGNWVRVGVLTQLVIVRAHSRSTPFEFNYTFTDDDALVGKVTFRAVARILDKRDAVPLDNEVTALATRVNG